MRKPKIFLAVLFVLVFIFTYAAWANVNGYEPPDNLAELEVLAISGEEIPDLDTDVLPGGPNSLKDLSFLKNAVNLKVLILISALNEEASLEPLAGLTGLNALFLVDAELGDADLKHLQGLTNLKCLYLNMNNLTNLEALSRLTNLIELHLDDNPLDYSNPANYATLNSFAQQGVRIYFSEDYAYNLPNAGTPNNHEAGCSRRQGFVLQFSPVEADNINISLDNIQVYIDGEPLGKEKYSVEQVTYTDKITDPWSDEELPALGLRVAISWQGGFIPDFGSTVTAIVERGAKIVEEQPV